MAPNLCQNKSRKIKMFVEIFLQKWNLVSKIFMFFLSSDLTGFSQNYQKVAF